MIAHRCGTPRSRSSHFLNPRLPCPFYHAASLCCPNFGPIRSPVVPSYFARKSGLGRNRANQRHLGDFHMQGFFSYGTYFHLAYASCAQRIKATPRCTTPVDPCLETRSLTFVSRSIFTITTQFSLLYSPRVLSVFLRKSTQCLSKCNSRLASTVVLI